MNEEPMYPDGLAAEHIDQLLCEARAHWTVSARPTSAFLDGTAEQRRERRMARRAIGAVVRALPTRQQSAALEGEVA